MPANTALRCHSNKADWSSRAGNDGVVGGPGTDVYEIDSGDNTKTVETQRICSGG